MEDRVSYKKIFYIVLPIIILIAVLLFYFLYYKNRPISREFDGQLTGASGFNLSVKGDFVYVQSPQKSDASRVMNVEMDGSTVIKKIVIHLPTTEELKATKGYFDGRDLKRDETMGTLTDFQKDVIATRTGVNIYAKSNSNIYKKTSFKATEIKYEIATQ